MDIGQLLKKFLKRIESLLLPVTVGLMQVVPPMDTSIPEETASSGASTISTVFILVIFLILVGLVVAGLYFFSRRLREDDREKKSKDGVLFEVSVPRGNETEIEIAKQMFSNVHGLGKVKGIQKWLEVQDAISFEIIGLPESIRFYVYAPKSISALVEKAINGSYPNAELRIVKDYNIFQEGAKVAYTSLKLAEDAYKPIKIYEGFKGDPMNTLTSAMAKFKAGEGGVIQILITPDTSSTAKAGRNYVHRVEESNKDPEKSKVNVSQEAMQAIDRKASNVMFRTVINIVTSAATKDDAKGAMDNIVGAFGQFADAGGNKFEKDEGSKLAPKREFISNFLYRRMPLEGGSPLNIEELATIWHMPNKNVQTPYIKWVLSKTLPFPDNLPNKGIWLGLTNYRGQDRDIYMLDDGDDRRRHMYVIGQTGVGKSQFITNLLMQDIYAGRGCAFIDPHGSDIDRVLGMIPAERMEDVIYFNPGDTDRPIGWNSMEYYDEQDKHIVVNSFIGMLKKMYDPHNQGITGPIFERSVRNVMLTAMAKKGSTLIEVLRLFMDVNMEYVKEYLPLLKDDLVRSFWEEEEANTDKFHKSEKLGYITSKFDSFITNTLMRNIIGQSESTINVRQVMDTGKILLINLSKGLIGEENSNFLGQLIVPAILRAALSRNDIPESERRDFFLYVDEFQNFATDEFATILAEARKYRLSLIVANQYIAQLSEQVREAVFGNAGTKVVFRVGAKDAEYLKNEFAPQIEDQDMVNLPNATAYIKMLIEGVNPPPFSMVTWDKSGKHDYPKNEQIKQSIIDLSRTRYGREKAVVEAEIKVRSGFDKKKEAAKPQSPPGFPKF